MSPLSTSQIIVLHECLTSDSCSTVLHTSKEDILAGTILGIRTFERNEDSIAMRKISSDLYAKSICESDGIIYILENETVTTRSYDFQHDKGSWNVNFGNQLSVSDNKVFVADSFRKQILRYKLDISWSLIARRRVVSGSEKRAITHHSFVKPTLIKTYTCDKNTILVVYDSEANLLSKFIDVKCIWQTEVRGCSAFAINPLTSDIWTLNSEQQVFTVFSTEGE